MAMDSVLRVLKDWNLLDPGVLALGLERGWVSEADVSAYAVEILLTGDNRVELAELATAEDLDLRSIVHLLRKLARLDSLPSVQVDNAIRRWMFAMLTSISMSGSNPEDQLDKVEDAYAMLDYPEEMRECSRYYVPPLHRAGGIQIGMQIASPLEAMNQLVLKLRSEFLDLGRTGHQGAGNDGS